MASATTVLLPNSMVSATAATALIVLDGVDGASAGDVIEYEIEIVNIGTTTLESAVISEPMLESQLERWAQHFV